MYALNRLMPKTFIPLHTMVRLTILGRFLKAESHYNTHRTKIGEVLLPNVAGSKVKPTNTLNHLLNMLNHCWQRRHLANIGLFFY